MAFQRFTTGAALGAMLLSTFFVATRVAAEEKAAVTDELDALWAEVSRSVEAGDFKGYAATCHPQGVLVSGVKKSSEPLTKALARWKAGIEDTRVGKMKASVQFRFTTRLTGATTAHETGIFRYTSQLKDEEPDIQYIHFEALLIKQDGKWLTLMEYQKSKATLAQWQAAKPHPKKVDLR